MLKDGEFDLDMAKRKFCGDKWREKKMKGETMRHTPYQIDAEQGERRKECKCLGDPVLPAAKGENPERGGGAHGAGRSIL
jgi:hypothetical protein